MNVPVIIVIVQPWAVCLHWKWVACRWNRTGSAPCWTSGAERRSRSCTPPLCVLSCEPAVWPGSTKYSTQVKPSACNSTFGIVNHWKGRVKKNIYIVNLPLCYLFNIRLRGIDILIGFLRVLRRPLRFSPLSLKSLFTLEGRKEKCSAISHS